MNLKLIRSPAEHDGRFGALYDENGNRVAKTLEHAYDSGNGDGSYTSKLPAGVYTCVRGEHQLHDNVPFQTFEITGVPGHSGILFHVGNYNKDSDGCVLLGADVIRYDNQGTRMLINSRSTFEKFMAKQVNVDKFTLTVVD